MYARLVADKRAHQLERSIAPTPVYPCLSCTRDLLASTASLFVKRGSPVVCSHIYFSSYSCAKRDAFGRNYYPSLFAAENISHHCRTNICFSTKGGREGKRARAFSVLCARLQVVDTMVDGATAIGKLAPVCTRITGTQKSSRNQLSRAVLGSWRSSRNSLHNICDKSSRARTQHTMLLRHQHFSVLFFPRYILKSRNSGSTFHKSDNLFG